MILKHDVRELKIQTEVGTAFVLGVSRFAVPVLLALQLAATHFAGTRHVCSLLPHRLH